MIYIYLSYVTHEWFSIEFKSLGNHLGHLCVFFYIIKMKIYCYLHYVYLKKISILYPVIVISSGFLGSI